MSSYLYKFPKAAEFGRVLPKNKIYKHARPNTKTKDLFIREVETTEYTEHTEQIFGSIIFRVFCVFRGFKKVSCFWLSGCWGQSLISPTWT